MFFLKFQTVLFDQIEVICYRLENLPATRTQAKISTTLMVKMNE